ncbi:MAG: hypothetical protein ACRDCT_19960 [Shewanella sp.]
MTKSAIVSILLCIAVLLGAMYFGSWTKHPYVQELTTEIRKASAVIEPKKPSAEVAPLVDTKTELPSSPKGIWDQMLDYSSPPKAPVSPLFNQSLPKQEDSATTQEDSATTPDHSGAVETRVEPLQ